MEKHSVGQTIAALRKKKGWTQVELAEKLQVSDKAVSKWEKDDSYPSIEFLPVLASLFGVTIDYLITGATKSEKVVENTPKKVEDEPVIEKPKQTRLVSKTSMIPHQPIVSSIEDIEIILNDMKTRLEKELNEKGEFKLI